MVITYYGHEFFKLQFGDTVIAVNPVSKQSSLKQTRFGADIVLLGSQNDPNKNGVDMVTHGEKVPFVISGPGEYEVGGIFVKGASITPEGAEAGKHPYMMTAYWLLLEGMRLCFLNGLSVKHLSKETREMIGEVGKAFKRNPGERVHLINCENVPDEARIPVLQRSREYLMKLWDEVQEGFRDE
jgi:hypothetical protein